MGAASWFFGGDELPDSGLLHNFDATDSDSITTSGGDVTEWTNQSGTVTLTGTVSGGLGSINGNQAIVWDAVDDVLSSTFGSNVTQPVDVFSVQQSTDDGRSQFVFDGYSNAVLAAARWDRDPDEWRMFAGGSSYGVTDLSENPELRTTRFDGASSAVWKNGSQSGTGDPGTNDFDGLTVGSVREGSAGPGSYFNGPIGQIAMYDPTASEYSRTDVESFFLNKWGI